MACKNKTGSRKALANLSDGSLSRSMQLKRPKSTNKKNSLKAKTPDPTRVMTPKKVAWSTMATAGMQYLRGLRKSLAAVSKPRAAAVHHASCSANHSERLSPNQHDTIVNIVSCASFLGAQQDLALLDGCVQVAVPFELHCEVSPIPGPLRALFKHELQASKRKVSQSGS
eukprot:1180640-Amphidinium_carterae.1